MNIEISTDNGESWQTVKTDESGIFQLPMKRYLLFGWDNYYPSGGMNDLIDSSDSLEVLKSKIGTALLNDNERWRCLTYKGEIIANKSPSGQAIEIYDTVTGETVFTEAT